MKETISIIFALTVFVSSAGWSQKLPLPHQAIPALCAPPEWPENSSARDVGPSRLQFLIDAKGRVLNGKVVQSSGFREYDRLALAALRRCTYLPLSAGGKPVRGSITVEYPWALD